MINLASVNLLLYIFNFKIPLLYSSSIVALIISFSFIIYKRNIKRVIFLYRDKFYLTSLFIYFLFFIFYFLFVTVFHQTYDYSLFENIPASSFYILAAPIIALHISNSSNYENLKSLEKINQAFYIQSLIILFAFVNPDLKLLIKSFQDPLQAIKADEYFGGGVRGLALSGGLFFNLSCLFVINFLILGYRIGHNHCKKNETALILILITASFTIGRTVFIGILLMYLLAFYISYKRKDLSSFLKQITKTLLLILFATFIAIFYIYNFKPELADQVVNLSRFAFEFIYNYTEEGTLSTSSTDVLKTMIFIPEISSLFWGDGKYTEIDGSYYMQTDSGYMRAILAFGVFSIILQIIHLSLALKFKGEGNYSKELAFFLFLTLLTMHAKGESLLYVYSYTCPIFLIFFIFKNCQKKDWVSLQQNQHLKGPSHN